MHLEGWEADENPITRGGVLRTEGGPFKNQRDLSNGVSGAGNASLNAVCVGEADMGRIVESMLVRLGRGDDGVEGALCFGAICSSCKHRESIDSNMDCGGSDLGGTGGIDKDKGRILSTGGEFGGVATGEGAGGGRSSRELDLRREPRVLRVRGGQTLVEEARCRFGGGGGAREAMEGSGRKDNGSRERLGDK